MRTLLVLSIGALAACTGAGLHRYPHQSIVIRSPLLGGALPSDAVSIAAPIEADYRVSSDAFVDQATLTALDAEHVCFAITLRTIADPTPLDRYTVYLRADDHVRSDARIEVTSQTTESIAGERYEITGHTSPCVAHQGHTCTRHAEHTSGHFVAATLSATTQSGTACFANDGFVTASTPVMELYVVASGGDTGVGFAWELGGP